MIRSRSAKLVPWGLVLSWVAIVVLGLINLYSASRASIPRAFGMQLVWYAVSILVAIPFLLVDYRVFERISVFLWWMVVILLGLALLSRPVAGTHRWIVLGPVRFQPSEAAKLVVVLALASYFSQRESPGLYPFKQILKPLLYIGIPALLIIAEPDLGTAMVVVFIGVTVLLIAGIEKKIIAIFVILAALAAPLGWFFVLKDYQKARIIAMFGGGEKTGAGYHSYQSLIAVGSGRLWGKGYMQGTQTQMRFLPEEHTDFVFAVFAEEMGFVGGVALIALYTVFLLSAIRIATQAREKFGMLLAAGMAAYFFYHYAINIGMVLRLLPVVGLTLPFFSYGGSSLLVSTVCLALLLNVYARR